MNIRTIFVIAAVLTCTFAQDCCDLNTIRVRGNAEVKVKPDQATIEVTVENIDRVTSRALSNMNTLLQEVISILEQNNIAKGDYSTSTIRITQ